MSPSSDDEVRPIPQRRPAGGQPPRPREDDVYVVDTRRRRKPRAEQPVRREPRPATTASAASPPTPATTAAPRRAPAATATRRLPEPRPAARPGGPSVPGERPPSTPSARPANRGGKPRWRRRLRLVVILLLAALVAWGTFLVWVPVHAWNSVTRIDATPAGDRPAAGKGHNYLLIGSDSREGLTAAQKKEYATGGDVGQRTDSIILVHVSSSGKSSLVSIPRDSYVPIPGHGSNKINSAYAFGGAKLLVRTVEKVTDLRIDGVMEIGFGGFAGLVDSVGGVWICVPFDMDDKDAGINLKKGCQTLDGKNALGFVRARHSDPRGDIGRAQRQRQFLAALMHKVATPSTVLIPTRYYRTMMSIASAVRVSDEMSMRDGYRVLKTLRGTSSGETLSFTVPLSTWNYPTANAGSAVKWDTARARRLFADLREDKALTAAPDGTDGQPTGG